MGVSAKEVRAAVHAAWEEQQRAKADIRAEGSASSRGWSATKDGACPRRTALSHRSEINHGIPEMIASYGLAVFTEDSLPLDFTPERPLRTVDQWVTIPVCIRRRNLSESGMIWN